MFARFVAVLCLCGAAACAPTTAPPPTEPAPITTPGPAPAKLPFVQAARNFDTAATRMEPVVERFCARNTQGVNCDFKIQVDPDRNAPPNAFQSLSPSGQPLLTFTQALIADARNIDEIAFVLGHEAAHHIAGHIPRQIESARNGAILGTLLAAALGADAATAEQLGRAGAAVGARRFSQDHELEADALGTILTHRAGYDPERGAAFFARIPDPGDRFLGTHPPNAQRIATVRRVAAGL